eukprot:SAG31_NODE_459_length_15396_cov_5.092502_9_plen_177_part_00
MKCLFHVRRANGALWGRSRQSDNALSVPADKQARRTAVGAPHVRLGHIGSQVSLPACHASQGRVQTLWLQVVFHVWRQNNTVVTDVSVRRVPLAASQRRIEQHAKLAKPVLPELTGGVSHVAQGRKRHSGCHSASRAQEGKSLTKRAPNVDANKACMTLAPSDMVQSGVKAMWWTL